MIFFNRLVKITLLIVISCIFFLPGLIIALNEEELKKTLEQEGFTVLYMEEIPILVPENSSFVIKNLDRLKDGENILELSITYEGKNYADVSLKAKLSVFSEKKDLSFSKREKVDDKNRGYSFKPGEIVEIVWLCKNILIRSSGRTLRYANAGEETEVLNLCFNTVVRGKITEGRKVIIP